MNHPLRWAAAVVALPIAFLFAGCSQTLDTGDLQKKIEDGVSSQNGVKVKVKCPDDIEAKKGKIVTCTATTTSGQKASIVVTLLDDNGKFSYRVKAAS